MIHYYSSYFGSSTEYVRARNPWHLEQALQTALVSEFAGCDPDEDFKALKQALTEKGLSVPPLYKHYAGVTEPDGVTFQAFNRDEQFGDCVDAFILVDLQKLKPSKRKRYLGTEETYHGGFPG